MSDAPPRDPQTLAEVRAGDVVTVFRNVLGTWRGADSVVEKITPKFIVLPKSRKFRIDTGSEEGRGNAAWGRGRIIVGAERAALLTANEKRDERERLDRTLKAFGAEHHADGLTRLRDACDAALKAMEGDDDA